MSNEVKVDELPRCNFCTADAEYDFATAMGPWANACANHWKRYRVSDQLGTGIGQKLVLRREVARPMTVGAALALALLGGCAESDPRSIVPCDPGWTAHTGEPIASCMAACQAAPTEATGFSSCRTGTIPATGQATFCPSADTVDEGCCVPMGDTVELYPCR